MDIPSPGIASPSALQIHGIKTATYDDDGLAPSCGPPDSEDEDDDDFVTVDISSNLRERLQQDPMNYRFFGKSSGVMLIQAAIDLKNEYTGNSIDRPDSPIIGAKRAEFWNVRPVSKFTRSSVILLLYDYSGNSQLSTRMFLSTNFRILISWSN